MKSHRPRKLLAAALGFACFSQAYALDLPPFQNPPGQPIQLNPDAAQQFRHPDQKFLLKKLNANLAILNFQPPREITIGENAQASITVQNPSSQANVDYYFAHLAVVDRDFTGQNIAFDGRHVVATLANLSLNANQSQQHNFNFTTPGLPHVGENFLCAQVYMARPLELESLKTPDNLVCRPLRIAQRPQCSPGRLAFRGDISSQNNCRGTLTASVNMHEQGRFDQGVFDIVPAAGSNCLVTHGDNLRGNLNANSSFQGDMRHGNQVVTIRFNGSTNVPNCTSVRGSFTIEAPVNDRGDFNLNR